jgi:ribosomal protein S14
MCTFAKAGPSCQALSGLDRDCRKCRAQQTVTSKLNLSRTQRLFSANGEVVKQHLGLDY